MKFENGKMNLSHNLNRKTKTKCNIRYESNGIKQVKIK